MENKLKFYEIMNYPVPQAKELFFLVDSVKDMFGKTSQNIEFDNSKFSFESKNVFLDDMLAYLEKYRWFFKNMPFVKAIYLCDAVSFGAINDKSKIELFIVYDDKRLWIGRIFSLLYFKIISFWTKQNRFELKFCATESGLNFFDISTKPIDIYLIYWIAHLTPIFACKTADLNLVFEKNAWVKNFLYNFPLKFVINLGQKTIIGGGFVKKILEKLLFSYLGDMLNKIFKIFYLPFLLNYKKKLGKNGWGVIITDNLIKLHKDIRRLVNIKYKFNK